MAVTKTHPIKSTLKAAIDYILNPEKTDGKLLASSFGCGLETADIEFAWTREAAGDRGTHLGRHLIQSFVIFQNSRFIADVTVQYLFEIKERLSADITSPFL